MRCFQSNKNGGKMYVVDDWLEMNKNEMFFVKFFLSLVSVCIILVILFSYKKVVEEACFVKTVLNKYRVLINGVSVKLINDFLLSGFGEKEKWIFWSRRAIFRKIHSMEFEIFIFLNYEKIFMTSKKYTSITFMTR